MGSSFSASLQEKGVSRGSWGPEDWRRVGRGTAEALVKEARHGMFLRATIQTPVVFSASCLLRPL